MRVFSTAAAALAVFGITSGLQQPLAMDTFPLKYQAGDEVLVKASKYLNAPLSGLTEEIRELWKQFVYHTDIVDGLKSSGGFSKITKQPFDFYVKDQTLPNYQLRIKSTPENLGLDTVQQYTGYLDIEDEEKHFFFWTFESRNDPTNDPVILWLTGGPGCSSSMGLFFELGPSSIDKDIKPVFNPYSWNNNATVIFLDQPANTGYSYTEKPVSDTVAAGKDVYAFLELFFKQFPQYAKLDFHIAAESYGGHYAPVYASEILSHPERSFNLTSVLIGNGLTDTLVQYEYYQPMACGEGGSEAVVDPQQCQIMDATKPLCLALINQCYDTESVWSCFPATVYCNEAQMGPYQRAGYNLYDVRLKCDGSQLCYESFDYIEKYLNKPEVLEAVGAEVSGHESCDDGLAASFMYSGDWMKPYYKKVIDVLEKGVPVLIYAGDKDFICNWLGEQAWTNRLQWSGSRGFAKAPIRKWEVDGEHAGNVKNYDNFTFLRIFGAGHMAPHDKPENSLDMVNRWIQGDYKL